MNYSIESVIDSLRSGFIDRRILSKVDFLPTLLINNPNQQIRVLTTIDDELGRCKSFWFSVAFVTTSGVASIINSLKGLEEKGIKGRILVSQYQNFTQPEALRRLLCLSNVELRISVDRDFHAKGYLFEHEDSYGLIVGSSNLTANALSRNVEWNLKVSAKLESLLMHQALKEFEAEFELGMPVNSQFIDIYEHTYRKAEARRFELQLYPPLQHKNPNEPGVEDGYIGVTPNKMQSEALANLQKIRADGLSRALLVSATGTGKTYLAAFDAKAFDAKRILFVVHRANIAKAAKISFEAIFGTTRSMGLYSGNNRELDKDFLFSTIQTLARPEHLHKFPANEFDYIIIDESHRAGANTYQTILNHFKPHFLLGMTATPERTDGFDIFKLFNHTIAYEIRLHRALAEDMLSPFHYYGVTDLIIDGEVVNETTDFNYLTCDERVNRILEKANLYGTDNGKVRGLVFCSRIEICIELAEAFNRRGQPSLALTGDSTEQERDEAIRRLELREGLEKLNYIFTVDIFNEGVDIPQVNQVIMLRPTQSAIIFVQQMGRGLRKALGKEYLTIIDFIGNYSNNYLVPIALYGDNSYNKDKLRKLMKGASSSIPGTSTINFDQISKDRIFSAIDSANMTLARDLKKDYQLLKFQLGRPPLMQDFLDHGSRDPQLYVKSKRSFFNFAETQEESLIGAIPLNSIKLLETFSRDSNNAKRVEESMMLSMLIENDVADLNQVAHQIQEKYGYTNDRAIQSAIHNLNLLFVREKKNGTMLPVGQILNHTTAKQDGDFLILEPEFKSQLENIVFREYLLDSCRYSIKAYDRNYDQSKFNKGFLYYQKYSRKDVFRILGWETNPVAQNVGGYIISDDKTNCPIFVTYHKADDIAESTKYEDYFINNSTFSWMSKSNRTLESSDVVAIKEYEKHGLRLPLFIKKTDDEGTEFYFIGDVKPIEESFEQSSIENDDGRKLPVVKICFSLDRAVENSMFNYLSQEH